MFLPLSDGRSCPLRPRRPRRPRPLAPSRRRPFRVLFLSVLRRFSLFFRPARSLKTGSRALPPRRQRPAGRPAGSYIRSYSLALQALARTRSHSLARSLACLERAAVTVGGGARTCALCARARTYFIAQTSEHVYRSLEYSELRSRRVYIRYTTAICNDPTATRYSPLLIGRSPFAREASADFLPFFRGARRFSFSISVFAFFFLSFLARARARAT